MSLLDRWLDTARALHLRPKALVDLHPEILERVHVMTIGIGGEQVTFPSYSYLNALGDYESHVWVRKAVLVVANNLAALPLQILRGDERVEQHDLLKLLTDVNDQLSSADLNFQWAVDMLLGGEEAWELVKSPRGTYTEIWPRQPHTLHIIPDAVGRRYYQVTSYRIDDGMPGNTPGQSGFTLPPDELVHFKFFNPRNPWRGLAPISAVRSGILIDQYAQAWSKLFFRKSARPDYAIIAPQGLTTTERDEIVLQLKAKFGGLENVHEPIVLEQGVTDIKPLDFRPKDLEWVNQRELARDEIAAVFGVPDGIMGWGPDSYDTATKLDGDMRALWTLTLIPLVTFRDTRLTEFFRRVGALANDESIVTDLTGVSSLRQDYGALIPHAVALFDRGIPWTIINDLLGLGLPKFPGWEVGYLPLGVTPVTSVKALAVPHQKSIRHVGVPEFGSDEHKALWQHKDTRLDKQRKIMKRQLKEEIVRQAREVKEKLRKRKVRPNGHKAPGGVALLTKIDAADVFDRDDEAERFAETFEPVVSEAVARAGQDELDNLDLGIDFDLERPEVRAALRNLLDEFATQTNETTYRELVNLFEQAEQDGASIPAIVERLDEYFEGRRDEASLERIARTTMTGANGAGDVTAWEQSGVVAKKAWLAALDDRTRDDHREAHGQEVDLDEDFRVGGERLEYPGDPAGSPEQIVNCRCSQTAILE